MSTRLTPLTKPLRRRVTIGGQDYEIAIDPKRPALMLRQMRHRVEFHIPLAALLDTTQEPLFAQEAIRARGRRVNR